MSYELDAVITSLNVTRLSKPMQSEWELYTKEVKRVPPIEEFIEFLRFRADALTSTKSSDHKPRPTELKPQQQPRKHRAAIHSTTPCSTNGPTSGFRYECQLCPGNKHPLFQCSIFSNMSVSQRGDYIRSKKLCYNCLAPGYKTVDCRSVARCRSCGGKHHTLVHENIAHQQW